MCIRDRFRWLAQVGDTKILWGDQDALNGVIDGGCTEMPNIYNGIVINNTTLNEALDLVLVHYIDYVPCGFAWRCGGTAGPGSKAIHGACRMGR